AGDEDVENAFDGRAVVGPRSPSVGWRWQQRLDECPMPICEMNPAHASSLVHPGSVSEPPLASPAQAFNDQRSLGRIARPVDISRAQAFIEIKKAQVKGQFGIG